MRPAEFWSMTWTEIDAACRGYEIRLARSREMERFIAAVLINANRKPGSKIISPENIVPLLTDNKPQKKGLVTPEEYDRLREMFNKVKWQTQN